jgi:predicted NBD/HSP70 family sugar kinase
MTIQFNGPLCGCGRRGCVEAFVGKQGILRSVREKLESGRKSLLREINPSKRTPKDVSEAALHDDAVAMEVLAEAGMHLGVGIGNVANLLNIQRAVVGGGVAKAGEYILGPARKSLQSVALETAARWIEVVPAVLGDKAGLVGAAHLAMVT